MFAQRIAIAGLAAVVGTTLATAGCTAAPGTPGAPTTSAKPATEVLSDAANKTKGQSFKYTVTYGTHLSGDGAQDGTGAKATRNVTFTNAASGLSIKGNVRVIGDTVYAKLDLGAITATIPGLAGLGDKWLTLDKKKIGGSGLAASVIPGGDAGKPETYINGVVSAEKVSDTEYKGTLDLAKSAPAGVSASELAKLGPETKNVPFTATLDGEGRISKIVIAMPAIESYPAADMTTTFSDYGATVDVTAPASADTVAAPDTVYLFLQ